MQQLLSTYSEVFRDELGTVSSTKVKLLVQPDARPKFFKPCSVPIAIKPAIDQELECLENAGILRKVSSSDWAAPIVPVPKRDGKFRICGDYKVTVNPHLDIEQYPLPKPQDLFVSLAGGQKFTNLDLYNRRTCHSSWKKIHNNILLLTSSWSFPLYWVAFWNRLGQPCTISEGDRYYPPGT